MKILRFSASIVMLLASLAAAAQQFAVPTFGQQPTFNTGAGQMVYFGGQQFVQQQQMVPVQSFGNFGGQQFVQQQQQYQPRLDLTANYTDPFLNRIQSLERGAYTAQVQAQIRCSQGNRSTINGQAAYNLIQSLDPTLRNGQDPGRAQYMVNVMTNGAAGCY